ncbi:putative 50 kDa protein in type I retrotransposable element R1DM [Lucilia cuprina]|nr:putative 50 kDa protein in type I retrotransposable element R1DM [Lucilia cuprina]
MYEVLLMALLAENERLNGRLESVAPSNPHTVFVAPKPVGTKAPVAASAAASVAPAAVSEVLVTPPVVHKPLETWSVGVKGKGVPADQVVEKMVTENGPTLGVRVHEIKPTRCGRAVIKTKVGLEVSVSQKLVPRVVVQRVHSELSVDEFMEELYAMNFRHKMSPQEFKKSVHLVSAPWKSTSGAVNVVLERGPQISARSETSKILLDMLSRRSLYKISKVGL